MIFKLFENFVNKKEDYTNISISYNGDDDKLFLIYYTEKDPFLEHNIISTVESKKDAIDKFNEESIKNTNLNGANVFNYKNILESYKTWDKELSKRNIIGDKLNKWIKNENNMLNKFGFKIDNV